MSDWKTTRENDLDYVNDLCACAKRYLERASRAPSTQFGMELQHHAIGLLMEAVEVHNNAYRHKVREDGTQVPEEDE